MPHVSLVALSGFRVREPEMLQLGMSLPGLQERASAIAELPALGLLTLAGLNPPHWTCTYHCPNICNEELIQQLVEERPTLVAVSALTASIEEAYWLCNRLRQEEILTVIGGLHATACPEEARRFGDAVVVGDGEPVWPQLLTDAEQGSLQPVYRSVEQARKFDDPLPRFDLLGSNPPRFTLQTQRGCPLACDFCGASRLLGKFREKPLKQIARELETIRTIEPQPLIELADDNTFVGNRDVDALFDLLQQSRARYFTEADWRIGERPEVLSRLSDSGCVQVLVGIESLVFRYPGMGGKQAELNRIMDAVSAIQEAGVVVNGCFIVGADGETRASMDRLVQFILDSPLAEVQITLQTPFPGTALYRRLKQQERLLSNRGWSNYTLFDVTYRPDSMTVEELERGFRNVLREVFSKEAAQQRKSFRRRIWDRNGRLRR